MQRFVASGAGVLAAVLLAGGLAGALRSSDTGSVSGPAQPAPASGVVPFQSTTSTWTCGPGPQRVSDMDVAEGGYLKADSGPATRPHQFYLARAMYTGFRGRGFWGGGGRDRLGDRGPAWSIDYPRADRVMTRVATRLSNLDACEWERPISLADPELRRYPFLYSLEWGYADLTEAEVAGLRGYLLAGGFLMLDDFWGNQEWRNFADQMRRVLPEYAIVDVPRDHAVFRSYYELDEEIMQVPNVGNGRAIARGMPAAYAAECRGCEAELRGIFDENGRLIVAINWNTDLGDALEWAESPMYPLAYSTFASRLFLNLIIYAMAY
ncbi:MAG: DUF4159 domain-containing protein [Gemmatimonadota bacterium]